MAKLAEGDPAPDFELPGTGGRTYRLSDYRGKGVVLAFYPGDFTPSCTAQFCSYRDNSDQLEELGVDVLGISPQSLDSHDRFTQRFGLNVPLLADEDKSVCRAYGILGPGGFVRRSVFVIDGDLAVRHSHVSLIGATYDDVDDLERAVAKLG
jgi:peroxiredoxin Q/BCP